MEREVTVQSELGLHARPAASFAALSNRFQSEIWVSRGSDEEWVNGKSVLSLLSLAAAQGTRLRIRAEGEDAREALEALEDLIRESRETRETGTDA
ncbi:MAG: HPr family phosphocarrier protein [Deltaproteobacteria bacterium]|nr:MAG: HPr family phosphocarrier protein [Deltaproteobacteria bacterium]